MQNVVKYLQPKHRRLNGTEADFREKKKEERDKIMEYNAASESHFAGNSGSKFIS